MAGFATDATHVSSSGTALAKTGIANAFANATNLADISTGDALDITPAGNADAPQATVNTLADILASCINSTGPSSTTCSTLLSTALSNGTSGTPPTDTATAAINIAHNPGVNISPLYALVTAEAPFQPTLPNAPDNFTVALFVSSLGPLLPQGLAVDASGNIWTASAFSGAVFEFSSLGAFISPVAGFNNPDSASQYPVRLAIDSAGNAWVVSSAHGGEAASVSKYSPSGVALSGTTGFLGGGLDNPTAIAIDGSDNVWIANSSSLAGPPGSESSVTEFSNNGTPISPIQGFNGGGMINGASIAIDSSGNVWIGNGSSEAISELSNSGTPISPAGGFTNGLAGSFYGIAVDASGNVWTANSPSASVSEFSSSGVPISPSGGFRLTESVQQRPYAIAIDGAQNVWIADDSAQSIVELSPAGDVVSPSVGFTNHYIAYPTDVAVDGSGNIWVADAEYDGVAEIIGAATPVVTPISAGVKNHTIASRP
jgi:sugar lactone lactonase YvrE